MIVVRAPLRISLGGGGTDLPFYSSKFGGELVGVAINKYNYIVIKKRDFYEDFLIRYSKTELVKDINEIQHPLIREALKLLEIKDPIEITAISDVPAGTGLGSSSAFLVALLKALHLHKREEVSAKTLAEEASHIEMNVLNEPIGKQDQYLSSFGGVINLKIKKDGSAIAGPLNITFSTREDLENNLLLFSTGITRSASEVIEEQKKSSEANEDIRDQMRIIKEIGMEIKNALEKGNVSQVGKWFNAHWEAKRKFSSKMTSPEIDEIYKIGLENGAKGGKLVGAGGGGFVLFYCEGNKSDLREQMQKKGLKELPIKFDLDGCKVVYDGR
jgi:D-glycero-alpha-D-manno-heptose-7-phosphate kinase